MAANRGKSGFLDAGLSKATMNKRIRQAALKLMLLQEEFTKKELDEAAAILASGENKSLLDFLSSKPTSPRRPNEPQRQNGNGLFRVFQELENSDPKKYQLLTEFETMVRDKSVLESLDDLRRFGLPVVFESLKVIPGFDCCGRLGHGSLSRHVVSAE